MCALRWLSFLLLSLGHVAMAAEALVPRAVPFKPAVTVLRRSDSGERIALKFHEGSGARLRRGVLLGGDGDRNADGRVTSADLTCAEMATRCEPGAAQRMTTPAHAAIGIDAKDGADHR